MLKKEKKLTGKEKAELMLVNEVRKDFEKRQLARKNYEAQWEMNINFYMGNQHCAINGNMDVTPVTAKYFWEQHQVFNHIAPIVERRLSKLARIRPKMNVIPSSNDEKDLKTASLCKKIINGVYNSEDMNKIICEVTRWSEICGTGFYKIVWNSSKGGVIGNIEGGGILKSGDVDVFAVSPFEIFPENSTQNLENQRSIIHAKAFHVDEIFNRWGVEVKGENATYFTLDKKNSAGNLNTIKNSNANFALVIERYEAPSIKYPNGRMIMIAGNKLLFVGELPYINGLDAERGFPFVKQDSLAQSGCFWGTSVIDRMIPLQLSYNAIKNRKHEFINRLSMGVLAVEDGSVDVDALEDDGLCPGKVLVYRQGANKPGFMGVENVSFDFLREEQALIEEFKTVSGVADFNNENYYTKAVSGTALAMMIEQDESKMLMTNENVKYAIKNVAKQILRLYKQFVKMPKLTKIVGDNGRLEMFYFNSSDIASDDIIFETKDDYSDSYAQRKELIFSLIDKHILDDDEGKMSSRTKLKVLELLGYGLWENSSDMKEKHISHAQEENYCFAKQEDVKISEIDDDEIHINEHISFMLSGEFKSLKNANPKLEKQMLEHIKAHKKQKMKILEENN